MSRVRRLANKSAASWQQVVVMESGKRHAYTTDLPKPTIYGLVTDLLPGKLYGVMDFDLI